MRVIEIESVCSFDMYNTFENGQCFRWNRYGDAYRGIVEGALVDIKVENQHSGALIFIEIIDKCNSFNPDILTKKFWENYLTIDAEYSNMCEKMKNKDEHMCAAVGFSPGLHLLRQNFEETLISFIISANNNVPRIKGIIQQISAKYGEHICGEVYSFPKIQQLASAQLNDLQKCGVGYRGAYIINSARRYLDENFKPELLDDLSYREARKIVMGFDGVGPKVADCVLLFSGVKTIAFPTDVWVKRVMGELYLDSQCSLNDVSVFAEKYFGAEAGLAQQFLFHYARQNKIGTDK